MWLVAHYSFTLLFHELQMQVRSLLYLEVLTWKGNQSYCSFDVLLYEFLLVERFTKRTLKESLMISVMFVLT